MVTVGTDVQQKQASVGVLLGVRTAGRPAVLLQVRPNHDSYPGACQVTAHGKLTDTELKLDEETAISTALGRKLREELGEVAAEVVEASMTDVVDLERVINSRGRLVVTRGVDLGIEYDAFQKLIVPGKDVGSFRACSDPADLLPLEDTHKTGGVPENETRLFQDEINAIKTFFRKIFRVQSA